MAAKLLNIDQVKLLKKDLEIQLDSKIISEQLVPKMNTFLGYLTFANSLDHFKQLTDRYGFVSLLDELIVGVSDDCIQPMKHLRNTFIEVCGNRSRMFKLPYQGSSGKMRKVGMEMDLYDKTYNPVNARNLLRSIAGDYWGTVDRSSTILNNRTFVLMNFSCSSHGGYILFSKKEIPELKPNMSSRDYTTDWMADFFVYMFEEGCDWALLWPLCASNVWDLVSKEWNKSRGSKGTVDYVTQFTNHANSSLQRWNSELGGRLKKVIDVI